MTRIDAVVAGVGRRPPRRASASQGDRAHRGAAVAAATQRACSRRQSSRLTVEASSLSGGVGGKRCWADLAAAERPT